MTATKARSTVPAAAETCDWSVDDIRAGVVSCHLTHLRGQCDATPFHGASLANRARTFVDATLDCHCRAKKCRFEEHMAPGVPRYALPADAPAATTAASPSLSQACLSRRRLAVCGLADAAIRAGVDPRDVRRHSSVAHPDVLPCRGRQQRLRDALRVRHQVYYIPDAVAIAARFSPPADAGNMPTAFWSVVTPHTHRHIQ